MPLTLAAPSLAELLIKKSRFIACVQPCSGREEAQSVVQALWRAHPGAAHVCWALIAGGGWTESFGALLNMQIVIVESP